MRGLGIQKILFTALFVDSISLYVKDFTQHSTVGNFLGILFYFFIQLKSQLSKKTILASHVISKVLHEQSGVKYYFPNIYHNL